MGRGANVPRWTTRSDSTEYAAKRCLSRTRASNLATLSHTERGRRAGGGGSPEGREREKSGARVGRFVWPRNGRSDVLRNTGGVGLVGSVSSASSARSDIRHQTSDIRQARQDPCLPAHHLLPREVCVCVCVYVESRCTLYGRGLLLLARAHSKLT